MTSSLLSCISRGSTGRKDSFRKFTMKSVSDHIRDKKTNIMLDVLFNYETRSILYGRVSKFFQQQLEEKIFNRDDLLMQIESNEKHKR